LFIKLAQVSSLLSPPSSSGNQFVSSFDDNSTQQRCNSSEKYAIIVHGWLESIATDWVHELVENLLRYRGGCVIFMDYSNHSIVQEYFTLVRKFDEISHVLLEKLHQLEGQGFDPKNLFMYGFSFGAQIAINTGNIYGEARIDSIDGELLAFD
jgi:Lipase